MFLARLLGAPKTFGAGDTWGALRHKRQLSSPNLAALDFTCRVKPESRAKNFRPFAEEYALEETLGTGGYAVVRRGVHRRTGDEYAVKVMKRPAPQYWHPMMQKKGTNFSSIKAEIATMKKINHPNCVHMFDVIIDELHDELGSSSSKAPR